MFEVNIYLETSIKGPGTRKGWYASTLEYLDRNRHAVTREDYVLEEQTTYNKSILCALLKSLKRLNASCFVNIYTGSDYLKNNVENRLPMWKKNGFLNAKGKPVKNQDEWKEVARLLSGHKIEFRMTSRHLYTQIMQDEAKRRFKSGKNVRKTECEGV